MSRLNRVACLFSLVLTAFAGLTVSAEAEQRLALVIGQGSYESGAPSTAVNDAGLVAQALTSAGFEVIQGRDLGSNDLRRIVRDFLDKAQAEPDSSVVIYLAGQGVQLEGENYLIPVDARIQRDVDVPLEGFRLSDLVRSLDGPPSRARIVIADLAREFPPVAGGQPIAKGLALMEPPPGFLIAFSSAPNIVVSDGKGPYGAYATALVEMIRQPGLPLDDVFSRIRLRVHEATNGLQVPWHASDLKTPFVFFEPAETAAAEPPVQRRRIADVPAEEAYAIAVEQDTIQGYQDFLRRYPDDRLARRVTALLAARREAVVWRRTVTRNTSEAYWTYLRRYPRGPHAADSRRRLVRLTAPVEPPPVFEEVIYEDLPPPLPVVEEIEVVEVVTIIREAPLPPPLPVYLLPPLDEDDEYFVTVLSAPPPPPLMVGILPIPVPIPVPVRARPPVVFYQPIAPVTPRGVVAIPVAPPPIQAPRPRGIPGVPRPRPVVIPVQGAIPGQPGVTAPVQPISVVNRPTAPAPGRDRPNFPRPGRPGGPGSAPGAGPGAPVVTPRLPTIPLPAGQPGQARPPGPATAQQPPAAGQPTPPPVTAPAAGAPAPAVQAPAEPSPGPNTRPGGSRPVPNDSAPTASGQPPAATPVTPPGQPGGPTAGRPERPNGRPRPGAPNIQTLPPATPPAGVRVPGAPALAPPVAKEPERPDAPGRRPGAQAEPERPTPPAAREPARPETPGNRPGARGEPDRPTLPAAAEPGLRRPRPDRALPELRRPATPETPPRALAPSPALGGRPGLDRTPGLLPNRPPVIRPERPSPAERVRPARPMPTERFAPPSPEMQPRRPPRPSPAEMQPMRPAAPPVARMPRPAPFMAQPQRPAPMAQPPRQAPPVAQMPRPAAPPMMQRPAGPPAAAAPRPQGPAQACRLPNGQPCQARR